MKTFISITLITILFFSCKTSGNLSKQEEIAQITEKIDNQEYKFRTQRALPMAGSPISVSNMYYLKVSKDTIEAYLPYYGRAYTAPLSSSDGGIKFTSTDFQYTKSDKQKGMWEINIVINDNQKRYNLSLNIGDNGSTTLNVRDSQRQPITFYGQIE